MDVSAAAAAVAAAQAPPHEQYHEEGEQPPPTSRICVKNLPKYVDEHRLRDHFTAKGEVTDAKVMKTRDGKSRCFGFVGFRSPAEAEAALKYFNKSFFDTMRLDVEFAYKFGSSEARRAWSKYTSGTSAHKKLSQPEKTGANTVPLGEAPAGAAADGKKGSSKKGQAAAEDPKLREFLQVMQPRGKQAIWTNDDLLPPGASAAAAATAAATAAAVAKQQAQQRAAAGGEQGGGSDDEYEELPAGAAAAAATPSSSEGGDPDGSGSGSEGEEEEGGQQGALARNAAVSDLDYLKSRVKASFDDDDDAFAAGAAGAAAAAAAAGGDSDLEEGSSGKDEAQEAQQAGSSGSEGEDDEAAATAGTTRQRQQATAAAEPQGAAGKQQRGRRIAAAAAAPDAADAELDAIFGGGDSGGQAAAGSEEEDADMADADVAGAVIGHADLAPASDDEAEADAEAGGRQAGGAGQGPAAVTEAEAEAHIADTGRLFIRNLPYTANEADLQQLFETYGDVSEVHLVLDRGTKKSKGFALVQYAEPQDAVRAHAELDASIFMGRLIHILPGKRPPPPPEAQADGGDGEGGEGGKRGGTSSFKEQKEQQLKAGAGNRSAWNTLFMRADTVAEAVAAHFGVSKADLLDREAGDLAVRMALGETQVIAATKRALAEAGADISKLEAAAAAGGKAAASKGVARSDSVLVVKNLPFSSSLEELETMFGAIGALGRLVLPPTRTLALVEYLEPQDARRAFKTLAYKRYQHVPLYLEWAPKGLFNSPPPPRPAVGRAPAGATPAATQAAHAAPAKAAAASKAASKAAADGGKAAAAGELLAVMAEAQSDEVESSSIFVKNLAWATEDAALKAHFDAGVSAAGGSVRSVKVAKKKGPDGKMLSAGFGFVECSSEAAAKAAVKALQGSTLDGHKLVLQLSTKKAGGDAAAASGKGGAAAGKRKQGQQAQQQPDTSKMVVRNVAFEATRKDMMGLFTPFGQIKSCRLPRKFDGTHRGFAFVDFSTKQEARNAMEAVQGAHLYGRRLVIEWAEEDGGLDELRAKTAAKYRGEEALGAAAAEPEEEQQPQRQRQKKKQRR